MDWYQPVQRPDAATALVARVRERRSRLLGVRYSLLIEQARTHVTRSCDTDRHLADRPLGGDSVQDFRERVESEFGRRACLKGDQVDETTRHCPASKERTASSDSILPVLKDTLGYTRALASTSPSELS